jgi:hypothetical protein
VLQNQHTLSQAAEKIGSKPHQVQEKFFQLVEFLVHHLQYIPTKELIGMLQMEFSVLWSVAVIIVSNVRL